MEFAHSGAKRKRDDTAYSRSSHPSQRNYDNRPERSDGRPQGRNWKSDQVKLNQIQEDERMREWVAQEDDFVLKQAKKKAEIRVREGRANPIDWLAVTLRPIDPTRNILDDEVDDSELDFIQPDSVLDGLSLPELSNLKKDIETYLNLETNAKNRDYWKIMQVICKDRQDKLQSRGPEGRVGNSVALDVDRLLAPKSYEDLEKLEKQIRIKLGSNQPIDTDYWQYLLNSLLVRKAKAKVKKIYESIIDSRLKTLRLENGQRAASEGKGLLTSLSNDAALVTNFEDLDPPSLLQLSGSDKGLEQLDEKLFLDRVARARQRIVNMSFVPVAKDARLPSQSTAVIDKGEARPQTQASRHHSHFTLTDERQLSNSAYDKEVAKGVGEDEEVFAGEEEVETKSKDQWVDQYRPRKPKYFNRVQMGYEWNKYNQTHYDHENPPPKVVQGYKFHMFYPDLIDNTKAPTFKIIREGGRKKGQSIAPAGEEDTCIVRFMAGPPYEDVAFRIVDRDWDYSAKHDRGFKSTFEKGILTLHFSFKKVFYRK